MTYTKMTYTKLQQINEQIKHIVSNANNIIINNAVKPEYKESLKDLIRTVHLLQTEYNRLQEKELVQKYDLANPFQRTTITQRPGYCGTCAHKKVEPEKEPCKDCFSTLTQPNYTSEHTKYCKDCRYEDLLTNEYPCYHCFRLENKPNWLPKIKETSI